MEHPKKARAPEADLRYFPAASAMLSIGKNCWTRGTTALTTQNTIACTRFVTSTRFSPTEDLYFYCILTIVSEWQLYLALILCFRMWPHGQKELAKNHLSTSCCLG